MIRHVKHFDSHKAMPFKVNDNRLLKKYTKVRERVSILINMFYVSETVYSDNDKCIKAKIKSSEDKVNTNFQIKKILKENASYKCLSLIMLSSVIRVSKKYHPETFSEEFQYEIKKKS